MTQDHPFKPVTNPMLLGLVGVAALMVSVNAAETTALTAKGRQIAAEYATMMDSLDKEIEAALPSVDAAKKQAFLEAKARFHDLKAPDKNAGPQDHLAYQAESEKLESALMEAARALLDDVAPFLGSDALDGKLMRTAILHHGTPEGLAAFAQQGDKEKALIDSLLADDELMKQVLVAGGADDGKYGKAMQIYHDILEASERARERGTIFQRLALGTALEMSPIGPGRVDRYMHYEKAYLDGELDPAFKDMSTWECRFITDGARSNEDLAWFRQMLRTYRPDHITNPDYKWRYARIVKSDLPYTSIRHDPSLGTGSQQALALGGSCGPRAWFGRLATRSFGIPSRKHPQTGHAAMSHWTPTGWQVNFGGWWSVSPGGLDFFLDSQAREFPEGYLQVLRAQWIADVLKEEDVSTISYGHGGGFWNALAFYKKRVLVADKKLSDEEIALAKLSSEEARLAGEADPIDDVQEATTIQIPEKDKKITTDKNGVITIPAVACTKPDNNTDKITFMPSWGEGMQIHYQRLGTRADALRYEIEVPAGGRYDLSATIAMVSRPQDAIVRVNRREIVHLTLPYTKGLWEETQPKAIELREGRNSIMVTFRQGNRGVSIKEFRLTPVNSGDLTSVTK